MVSRTSFIVPLLLILALSLGCTPLVIDPVGDQAVDEGGSLLVTVSATALGGAIPSLAASNLPPGALFADNGDGTGTLTYTAPLGHSLVFENVTFTATTPDFSATQSIHIFVDDTDPEGFRVRFFHQGKTGQHGIALDTAGDLYLGDFNSTVWKVSGGVESIFTQIFGQDPSGMAFDASGILHVSATNGTGIWRVQPDGTKSFFSSVPNPWELDFDSLGNLYAASHGGSIYQVAPDGTASEFSSGYTLPFGVAVDSSDNVFITEHTLGKIHRIDPLGIPVQFADGFTNPEGLAIDSLDNLFVADTAEGTITQFTPTAVPTLLASGISFPVCMDFGPDGALYLACAGTSGRVYRLTQNP
jgi:sugar lactone lactonase YvrE